MPRPKLHCSSARAYYDTLIEVHPGCARDFIEGTHFSDDNDINR